MTLPQRHARHLRLVAGSEAAARAAVPRLEDALRCASLPDAGSRLLLVRRLALGRLQRQASSQAIARVIEARFAEGGVVWTEGAMDDEPRAERVVFASAWHARVALAGRLLRGQRVSAWYWPLAVPEFKAGIGAGDNLRAIARTLARSAEARVALPAWAVRVVHAGGGPALVALLPDPLGETLLREAGLPLPTLAQGAAIGVAAPSPAGAAMPVGCVSPGNPRCAAMPPWLQCLLQAGGWRDAAFAATALRARQPRSLSTAQRVAPSRTREDGAGGAPEADAISAQREAPAPASRPGWEMFVARDAAVAAHAPSAADPGFDAPVDSLAGVTGFDSLPTDFGGLPFLLPVLARLGLPRWTEAADGDPAAWTRAVLAASLVRLQAPADDPAWLLGTRDEALPRIDAPALPAWQNLLLARRGPLAQPLPQALAEAPTAAAQVDLWLAVVRRWLHRGARIGLASLVCRPGSLGLTPTHLDMHFALSTVDLRVRRLGLDLDPGWLPWFGRVVSFHYDEPAP